MSSEQDTHPAVGKEAVRVECLTQESEPDLCDGWSAKLYLTGPAYEDEDRIVLPGFDGICPWCGDSSFRVEGRELTFHV